MGWIPKTKYSQFPLDDPALFGFHVCDRCGKETPSGQYIDEADQWLCNDCLLWLQEAAEAAHHSEIEGAGPPAQRKE